MEVGVYSDSTTWSQIFGGVSACPDVNTVPLYWLPKGKAYDGQSNFDSYATDKIGGWSKPTLKTIANKTVCSYPVNVNYI